MNESSAGGTRPAEPRGRRSPRYEFWLLAAKHPAIDHRASRADDTCAGNDLRPLNVHLRGRHGARAGNARAIAKDHSAFGGRSKRNKNQESERKFFHSLRSHSERAPIDGARRKVHCLAVRENFGRGRRQDPVDSCFGDPKRSVDSAGILCVEPWTPRIGLRSPLIVDRKDKTEALMDPISAHGHLMSPRAIPISDKEPGLNRGNRAKI